MVKVLIVLDDEVHRKLKLRAIREGFFLKDYLPLVLNNFVNDKKLLKVVEDE